MEKFYSLINQYLILNLGLRGLLEGANKPWRRLGIELADGIGIFLISVDYVKEQRIIFLRYYPLPSNI